MRPVGAIAGSRRRGGGSGSASTGEPTATWNPDDRSADIALSATGQTATGTAIAGYRNARGIPAVPPGGTGYFEADIVADGAGLGWADAAGALANFMGCDGDSIGYYHHGYVTYGGGAGGGHATYAPGDTVMCAIDRRAPNAMVWFGLNGTWEGDPEAGTGGSGPIASFVGGVVPFFGADDGFAASATLRGTLAYAPPSWADVL